HRLDPLRVKPLRFGGERVGEPKGALGGSKAVTFEQCAGAFSSLLRSLEQRPRRYAASPRPDLPQSHLFPEPLAEELCDSWCQAVPNYQCGRGRLLEARSLEVRPAGAVDQSDHDLVAVSPFLHTSLHQRPCRQGSRHTIARDRKSTR